MGGDGLVMMTLMTLLMGCWPDDGARSELDFSDIPYENSFLAAPATITFFDTTLPCPDGQGTRFAAVYPDSAEGPAPVAIVLHSGAFDYLTGDTLDGPFFYTPSRLDRGWAISKVWETLGLSLDEVDASEENLGTLTAALSDAGFVQLLPANCWGDLWHNEQGAQDNDYSQESFSRNGRTIAGWMTQLVTDEAFASGQGFSVPIELDASRIFLVGLGEGGRAVTELLLREQTPDIAGILLDSVPDDLTPYVEPLDAFADIEVGLSRIFGEKDLARISDWSMRALISDNTPLPPRIGLVWSDGDPRMPIDAIRPTAEAIAGLPGAWVHNSRATRHILLNADPDLAAQAVEYLLTGTIPGEAATTTDTGDTGR
jgi:hypothetical protein